MSEVRPERERLDPSIPPEPDLPPDPAAAEHTREYSVIVPGFMVEGEEASEEAWADYYRRWCADLGLHPVSEPTVELRPQSDFEPDWAIRVENDGRQCWVATGWVY